MRIKRENGWASIEKDGCTIVRVTNNECDSRSPFSKLEAVDIVEKIYDDLILKPIYTSDSTTVYISKNGKELLSIYWGENDDWRYGIKTKEEAEELAREFIRLYELDELPKPKVKTVRIPYTCGSTVPVEVDGETVAEFGSRREAKEFFSDYLNLDDEWSSWGLHSHHGGWDRSIRRGSLEGRELRKYVLLLCDYMNENWDRCR